MKIRFFAIVIALVLSAIHPNSVSAKDVVLATPVVVGSPNVGVWNNTEVDIIQLYIAPSSDPEWGENLISFTMGPEEGFGFNSTLSSDVCVFNLLAVSSTGDLYGRASQDFCASTEVYIYPPSSDDNADD